MSRKNRKNKLCPECGSGKKGDCFITRVNFITGEVPHCSACEDSRKAKEKNERRKRIREERKLVADICKGLKG